MSNTTHRRPTGPWRKERSDACHFLAFATLAACCQRDRYYRVKTHLDAGFPSKRVRSSTTRDIADRWKKGLAAL